MYMEELNEHYTKRAGNSAAQSDPANVEPDGDITDMIRPEKVDVILPRKAG
jgi:hypothetical protein